MRSAKKVLCRSVLPTETVRASAIVSFDSNPSVKYSTPSSRKMLFISAKCPLFTLGWNQPSQKSSRLTLVAVGR